MTPGTTTNRYGQIVSAPPKTPPTCVGSQVTGCTMTAVQKAAYDKSMSEMQHAAGAAAVASVAAAAAAAEEQRKRVVLSTSGAAYAALPRAPYPPPAPPLVADAQAAAAEAAKQAAAAAAATTSAQAQNAAGLASVAAMKAIRKAMGAPNSLEARSASASATAALNTAATAVAKWTKEPVDVVAKRLASTGAVAAQAEASLSTNTISALFGSLAAVWAKTTLDWRFWTGVGAAAYGTWLRYRR